MLKLNVTSNTSSEQEQNSIVEKIIADNPPIGQPINGDNSNLRKSPSITGCIQKEQVNYSGKENFKSNEGNILTMENEENLDTNDDIEVGNGEADFVANDEEFPLVENDIANQDNEDMGALIENCNTNHSDHNFECSDTCSVVIQGLPSINDQQTILDVNNEEEMDDAISIGRHRPRKSIDLGDGKNKKGSQHIVLVSLIQTRRMAVFNGPTKIILMKILIWNIRGVSNSSSQIFFESMKLNLKFDILVLLEPKVMIEKYRRKSLKKFHFDNVITNVSHKIWCFYNSELVATTLMNHERFLHMSFLDQRRVNNSFVLLSMLSARNWNAGDFGMV
ncbi:hypothetical protein Pfo_018228 [Paulownia fortunei]|nr:hypothetical protein Pfo_018228 [Paulownia fortunei]